MDHKFTEQDLRDFFERMKGMTDAEVLVALYEGERKQEFAFALAAAVEARARGIQMGTMQ